MRKENYNTERMKGLEKCGAITCIHCVAGLCSNCKGCDFYERTFIQED
ncbi:hypothetical protein [Marinisporobacter balticus]|uniref:Uncharacterized protein n=1 Tax=Marinisporobacter balticus TaxID=2018667 RepID=A0A4R2KH80_9FIRM|nr:hypothetical protein [Marinisporobacter balticus]TCO69846.1 hypothetical protein EV214_12918 [Marinisporobacter balticus]